MINCNPETVSTDYDEVDRLYFDEILFESVMDIYGFENCKGVILSGGQIADNIAMSLHRKDVKIIGTNPRILTTRKIDLSFQECWTKLVSTNPNGKNSQTRLQIKIICDEVGYPCLIRPSYVLSGGLRCR